MKQFDYMIVGQGLAGTILGFQLREKGKSVVVIDKHREQTSSKVALGAYNPMVLKRFTPCWNVELQLKPLYDFVDAFEKTYRVSIHESLKLWRKFHSVQEQNLWLEKSEHPRLKAFMNPNFIPNENDKINAEFGYGEVNNSGRVQLEKLISIFKDSLQSEECFLDDDFNYDALVVSPSFVTYKSFKADRLIFCEGHRLTNNPYFNYLPLMRTKGEILTVKLKGFQVKQLLKSNISVLSLGDDLYKVGATFNWTDKDEVVTEQAREELLDKLAELVCIQPEVIRQVAGIRPTVKDRRALIGSHPIYENVLVFNGLGTRGLLIGPYLSLQLIDFMEKGTLLHPEVHIKRYEKEMTC